MADSSSSKVGYTIVNPRNSSGRLTAESIRAASSALATELLQAQSDYEAGRPVRAGLVRDKNKRPITQKKV